MVEKKTVETKTETAKTPEQMKTLENWAMDKATPSWVLEGTKYLMSWKHGRSVTEAEYDAAVEYFLTGPADGRKE